MHSLNEKAFSDDVFRQVGLNLKTKTVHIPFFTAIKYKRNPSFHHGLAESCAMDGMAFEPHSRRNTSITYIL